MQIIANSYRAAIQKHNKQPNFLLMHKNDYEKLKEGQPLHSTKISNIPIVVTDCVRETQPKFVYE